MIKHVIAVLILVLVVASIGAAPATSPATRPYVAEPHSPALADVRLDLKTAVGTPGYFRVGKDVAGRWWLIDPDGGPFVYRGVNGVNYADAPGRRPANGVTYGETVRKKYDLARSPEGFAVAVEKRLREWGFNALGLDASAELRERSLPYVETVDFADVDKALVLRIDEMVLLPDVFDPGWEKAIDARARDKCAPRNSSRLLVGYFTDSELRWAQPKVVEPAEEVERKLPGTPVPESARPTLLHVLLAQDGNRPATKAAREFVRGRYPNDAAVARAWGIPAYTIAALTKDVAMRHGYATPAYLKDQADFSRLFAERYFRLSAAAIRKHDPNHLILGCRFDDPPGDAVLSACKRPHVDVVSANTLRASLYDRMEIYARATGLPVMIGQFAFADDYFTSADAGKNDREQRRRQRAPAAVAEVMRHPSMVGYAWLTWVQETNSNGIEFGLVDEKDVPDGKNVPMMKDANGRSESAATRPVTPKK